MASGDTLFIFTPLYNEPPLSGYATLDTRLGNAILNFDDTSNEEAVFKGTMPRSYGGNGITCNIYWTNGAATSSGTCDWDIGFEDGGTQDLSATSFAAVNSIDNKTATNTTTGGQVTTSTVTFTDGADMDSVGAGDPFRLSITRDATSDDLTGDASLYQIEVRET